VLNLANGPGTSPDDAFLPALARLRDAKVPVAGYIGTDYGRRSNGDALRETSRYMDWYGVTGVFDRVSAGAAELDHYAALASRPGDRHRHGGVQPRGAPGRGLCGVRRPAQYVRGPWSVYLDAGVPRWARALPAEKYFHLVFSVPPRYLGGALALAKQRHAGNAFVTNYGGENPWRCLPKDCPRTGSRP
jgi:hypothetical protein